MSKDEILRCNKLIARFMYEKSFNDNGEDCYCESYSGMIDFYIENAKYHKSWDWLIPVWNKILKFGKSEFGFQWEQSIGETFITINTGNHNKFKLIWLNSGEIKDVYYVIVEFIKWYNSCQKE